jgi:hypothetical protein
MELGKFMESRNFGIEVLELEGISKWFRVLALFFKHHLLLAVTFTNKV